MRLRICRNGTTRLVVLAWDSAIKFARDGNGIRCNELESQWWLTATETNRPLLCPVLWVSPDYRILIMKRAEPATEKDMKQRPEFDLRGITEPAELKPTDWGWVEGRLVAVDYSAHYWSPHEWPR